MSKTSVLWIFAGVLLTLSLSGAVWANPNPAVPILFVNTIDNNVAGATLPDVLLTPAGYTNVTTVTTIEDFNREWQNRRNYYVLIFAYHSFLNDPQLLEWLQAEGANLDAWVKERGIFIGTAGRDNEEAPLAELFGLSYSDPGTGAEAIVPVEADTPFVAGIADGQMDASQSSDNTPINGQIYDEPFPSWVEFVVTRNAAGQPNSVAGHYGKGVLWLGSGFEVTNIGSGEDAEASKFTGYRTLWENVLNWATEGVVSVAPAGKLATTWGTLKGN